MWIREPLQIAGTDRWRLTVRSDEDGGGPYGDNSHDHATPEECTECEQCDEYCSKISGFLVKKLEAEWQEQENRRQYERLKKLYGHTKPGNLCPKCGVYEIQHEDIGVCPNCEAGNPRFTG